VPVKTTNDEGSSSTSNHGTSVVAPKKATDHKASLDGSTVSNVDQTTQSTTATTTTFHSGNRFSKLKLPSPRQPLRREDAPATAGGGNNPDSSTNVHPSADRRRPSVGQETTRAAAVSHTESVAPLPSTTHEAVVARHVEARPNNDGTGGASTTNTNEAVVVRQVVVVDVEQAEPPPSAVASSGPGKIARNTSTPGGITPGGAKVTKLRRSTVTGGAPVSDYRFVSS
jgi:hypothetical protein